MPITTAKLVKEIQIKDPETMGKVWVAIYKHENGTLFGVSSSYLDSVFEDVPVMLPNIFGDLKPKDAVLLND
jgi:hypothetical protein